MELKLSLDFYGFKKMFGDVLEWATEQQKNDIFEYFEELSGCYGEIEEGVIRDTINFKMVCQSHEDVINDYDCIKEYMEDKDLTLYDALSYYKFVYSIDDENVVYDRF